MLTAQVIDAVDVLEHGSFGFATGLLPAPPDQFGLDGLENGLNGGVLVAVTLAAYLRQQDLFPQAHLIVKRTILAAAAAMEDAAPRWG